MYTRLSRLFVPRLRRSRWRKLVRGDWPNPMFNTVLLFSSLRGLAASRFTHGVIAVTRFKSTRSSTINSRRFGKDRSSRNGRRARLKSIQTLYKLTNHEISQLVRPSFFYSFNAVYQLRKVYSAFRNSFAKSIHFRPLILPACVIKF